MISVGEIKKGAMKLANDLEEIIPINQKINRDYNQLIADLSSVLDGTSSVEVEEVIAGINEALKQLEQEKSNMMAAVIDIQQITNRL